MSEPMIAVRVVREFLNEEVTAAFAERVRASRDMKYSEAAVLTGHLDVLEGVGSWLSEQPTTTPPSPDVLRELVEAAEELVRRLDAGQRPGGGSHVTPRLRAAIAKARGE